MILVEEIKHYDRRHYARRASQANSCCGGSSCCGPRVDTAARRENELATLVGPSLGCGSPLAFAELQLGETAVDLGSGAGREVLAAARAVGPSGWSIGVDMTPEMIAQARTNVQRAGIPNAEFRLGEIEHLPLTDATADVVISNCVINLVPDKTRAFQEAHRVLRAGGRLVVSDMVSNGPLPEEVRTNPEAWAGCIAGAIDLSAYLATIEAAGFRNVEVVEAGSAVRGQVFSVTVRARRPSN